MLSSSHHHQQPCPGHSALITGDQEVLAQNFPTFLRAKEPKAEEAWGFKGVTEKKQSRLSWVPAGYDQGIRKKLWSCCLLGREYVPGPCFYKSLPSMTCTQGQVENVESKVIKKQINKTYLEMGLIYRKGNLI